MYPPFNACIYCGRADQPLSREHIIPYALGGQLTIPRASCPEHAVVTSQFEREVAQMAYGYLRAVIGAPSRRKDRHKATLASRVTVTGKNLRGEEVAIQVPISHIPPYEFVLNLPQPGILRGAEPSATGEVSFDTFLPHSNPLRKLRERLGLSEINTPVMSFPVTGFMRMIAKIGHAYLMAELGPGRYESDVRDFILGDTSEAWYRVGGYEPPASQVSPALSYRVIPSPSGNLLAVDISLAVFPRLPRYQVVCGRLRSEA